MHWTAVAPVPMMATRLSVSGQVPLGVATGIVVVPAAGVEGMALEGGDAWDTRQLWPIERSVGHGHELGSDGVTPVGVNNPASARVVPAHLAHPGLEAGVLVQVVVAGDGLAVFEDLGCVRIFVFRDVVQLLEQRQVAIRLDVAHGAGVAVPIPRAAEVTGLLNHPEVVEAGLAQPSAHEQTAETAADDSHLHLVVERGAFGPLGVGVVSVAGEFVSDLLVLCVPVLAQPLVALKAIFGRKLSRVKAQLFLWVAA